MGTGCSWLNGYLESAAAAHLVKRQLVVCKFEDIGDHALRADLAAIEVGNCTREAVCLRE